MKKALALAFVVATATSLSACGFALRGSDHTAAVIAPANLSTQLILEDNQFALGLKRPLVKRLQLLGVSEQATAANTIKVDNLRLRRYELVGTLTEVRLVMMADVSYNEASVVTVDQQGEKTKTWLYDHLAQRIAEQYYAKAKL